MSDQFKMTRLSLEQTLAIRAEERQRERREIELRDLAADQVEGILRSLIADPTAASLHETILAGLLEGRPLPMPQAIRAGGDAGLQRVVGRLEVVASGLEALASRPRRQAEPPSVPRTHAAFRAEPPVAPPVAPAVAPAGGSPGPLAKDLLEAIRHVPAAPAPVPNPGGAPAPAARGPDTAPRVPYAKPPRAGSGKPRGSSDSAQLMDIAIGLARKTGRLLTIAGVRAEADAEGFSFVNKDLKYVDDLMAKYAIKFPVRGGEDYWWPFEEPLPEEIPYRQAILPRFDKGIGERNIANWNNSKTPDQAIDYKPRGSRVASEPAVDED